MARTKMFNKEELMVMLAEIVIRYGYLSYSTIDKAHKESPFEFPSERTIRRTMGGSRVFTHSDFQDKLKPYVDKLRKK